MLAAEFFQDLFAGAVATGLGFLCLLVEFHLLEENFPDLTRRVEVKFSPGILVYLLFDIAELRGEYLGGFAEGSGVERYSRSLHFGQDVNQRHLDVVEELLDIFRLELRLEEIPKLESNVGILGGIFRNLLERDVAHVALLLSLRADEVFDGDGFIFKIRFRQVIHVVSKFGVDEVVRNHRVEQRPRHLNPVPTECQDIKFDILSHLRYGRILQGRGEGREDTLRLFHIGRNRDIPCLVRSDGKRHSDQMRTQRVEAVRLRVKCENFLCSQKTGKIEPFFFCINEVISVSGRV